MNLPDRISHVVHAFEARGFTNVATRWNGALLRYGALRLFVERHADGEAVVWQARLQEDDGFALLDTFLRTTTDLVCFVIRVDEIRKELRTTGRLGLKP